MLRCVDCGGRAIPGLAHLHGNPTRPLCHVCTERRLRAPKEEKPGKSDVRRPDGPIWVRPQAGLKAA